MSAAAAASSSSPHAGWLPARARWNDPGLSPCLPLIMGVVNATPDSFYGGARHGSGAGVIDAAMALVEAGADVVDVGGESTRPGARGISEAEELDRVLPVIEALARDGRVRVSVDTSRAGVMRAAAAAGAGLLNDVRAFRADGALDTAAALGLPVCVMHMRGEPRTMQADPRYDDVVGEVHTYLGARAAQCVAAGLAPGAVLVDPGIGFGKRLAHNLALLQALPRLAAGSHPVLLGASRKSMLGELVDQPAERRLYASLAVAQHAARCGVAVLRVHDVRATVEALRVWHAIEHAPAFDGDSLQ